MTDTLNLDDASTHELVSELLLRIYETNGLEFVDDDLLRALIAHVSTHLEG